MGPEANAGLVAGMEDVRAVYQRLYARGYPQVCVDEGSKQLVSSQRESLPMQSGKPQREDYEYEREGYCSVFVAWEPIVGPRRLDRRPRRTRRDLAEFVSDLIDGRYPDAQELGLVMANLNNQPLDPLFHVFPSQIS